MRRFATKNGSNEFAWNVYFRYCDTKFVKDWELLRQAYMEYYSYNRAIEIGTRMQNLNHAVRQFTKVYDDLMPNLCKFLKSNYAFMDNGALNDLISENRLEVEKVLKLEQKESKKLEIKSVRQNFEV